MKKSTLIFGLTGVVCGLLLMFLGGARQNTSSAVFGMIILMVSAVGLVIRSVFRK